MLTAFIVCLMRAHRDPSNGIHFTLLPAPDEETPQDLEQQQEHMRRMPVTILDGVRSGQLGGGLIGSIQGSGDCAPPVDIHTALSALPTLSAAFAAWIGARSGRKVGITVGNIEIQAGSAKEASALLQQAQRAKRKRR